MGLSLVREPMGTRPRGLILVGSQEDGTGRGENRRGQRLRHAEAAGGRPHELEVGIRPAW